MPKRGSPTRAEALAASGQATSAHRHTQAGHEQRHESLRLASVGRRRSGASEVLYETVTLTCGDIQRIAP